MTKTLTRWWAFLWAAFAAVAMAQSPAPTPPDPTDGAALWQQANSAARAGRSADALALFETAEPLLGDQIEFAVDHARTLGIAGARAHNTAWLNSAYARFARIQALAPQHTHNLQNWAITLFLTGQYQEAWRKVKQAEATPGWTTLDPEFLNALRSKMPRP